MRREVLPGQRRGLRQVICAVLSLVLLLEMLPVYMVEASADEAAVSVLQNGSAVDAVTVSETEKATVTAAAAGFGAAPAYQWQILVNNEQWVNIYNVTEDTLVLSHVLIDPVLDDAGTAHIRCVAVSGEQRAESPSVTVRMEHDMSLEEEELLLRQAAVSPAAAADAPQTAAKRSLFQRLTRDVPEYILITINYLDAVSGLPIYTSYTAQIKSGTAYESKIISPTYLGYAPYYNKDDLTIAVPDDGTEVNTPDDAREIPLHVTEDYSDATYTVNVYYKAINVPYGVRYYFQNINDDFYTEDAGLYRQGYAKTGTIISSETLQVPDSERTRGFTELYHRPEAVAADGSTVFECYYDRNYSMLMFDMDGGYGTEPIYARYGTPFLVNQPTRHGYVFGGWDLLVDGAGDGTADTLPITVPDENQTYRAIWKAADTEYTTVYWLNHSTDDGYSYIGSVRRSATSGQYISGSDDLTADTYVCYSSSENHTHSDSCKPKYFRHYVYERADQNVLVKGNGSTVINVYYTRRMYTLRFYYAKEYHNPTTDTSTYSIVGGSTYNFGNRDEKTHPRPKDSSGNVLNDIGSLLQNVNKDSKQWGDIAELPTIPAMYNTGTYPAEGYNSLHDRYYYFEFTAPFGADLTELWPAEVFDRLPVSSTHTSNGANNYMDDGQWGHYAYFAGWNGEYNVKYNQDNANATIKCYYPILDETLLYDAKFIDQYGDPDVINFLAFFDNGADVSWSVPREWLYKLYTEVLPEERGDADVIERDGVYYRLHKTVDATDNNTTIGHQTRPPLPGFTAEGLANDKEQVNNDTLEDGRLSFTAKFYYKRLSYDLTAHNHNTLFEQTRLLYEMPLDERAAVTPPYPSTLEENAYTFAGWYFSPGCFEDSEYVPGTTMPSHSVSVYAKWAPVQHTVRFFRTYNDLLAYQQSGDESLVFHEAAVDHGDVLGSVENPDDQSGHSYTFGGWFYMLSGSKTAYTPLDIPVTKDLNVFADWGSHTAQPYRIHYVLLEAEKDSDWMALAQEAAGYEPADNAAYTVTRNDKSRTYVYLASDGGYHLSIAPDTSGFAYQGSTRTFYPKAGTPFDQLYDGYNTGYFPTLGSHSITIDYEENKQHPQQNVFTFTYVHAESVSYTVEYRYQSTGELIASAPGGGREKKTTSMAVITERFAVIPDYLPDAFYKRLILAVEDDGNGNYVGSKSNVVTFYYTKNDANAYYAVHFMLQNVDAVSDSLAKNADGSYVNYTADLAHMEGIGEVGKTVDVVPQSYRGFTLFSTAHTGDGQTITLGGGDNPAFTITVKHDGTELYIFYKRDVQNYRVYHLAYGTDVSDLASLTYEPDDETHANGVLLPIETDSGLYGSTVSAQSAIVAGYNCVSAFTQSILLRHDDNQNTIVFYYAPLQYTVEYKVWRFGGGTLSRTLEVVNGLAPFEGSVATAQNGYTFAGWYLDEDCTVPAASTPPDDTDKAIVADSKLTPVTANLLAAPNSNVFYAKFTPRCGDLTITRSNTADEGNGTQVFVYKITSQEDPASVINVTITGSGSVTVHDLICGAYTVEQQNGWSWRYGDGSQTAEVIEGNNVDVTFSADAEKVYWLNGSSDVVSNRKG
mgnify:FL=1